MTTGPRVGLMPGLVGVLFALQSTLVAQGTPTGTTRELVCRGKAHLDLTVEKDPSDANPSSVTMLLRYERSDRKVGADYRQLKEGTCTWNPYGFEGIPSEPGEVHFDVAREAQPWSATGTRQLDTTVNAAAFLPDPISLPRYLGRPEGYFVFYVNDASHVSGSFGALRELLGVTSLTWVSFTGPWPGGAAPPPPGGVSLGDARGAIDQMNNPGRPTTGSRTGQSTERAPVGGTSPIAGERPVGQGTTADVAGVGQQQYPTDPILPDPSRSIPTDPDRTRSIPTQPTRTVPPNPIREPVLTSPTVTRQGPGPRDSAPAGRTRPEGRAATNVTIGGVSVVQGAGGPALSFRVTGRIVGNPEVTLSQAQRSRGTNDGMTSATTSMVLTVEPGPNGTWRARPSSPLGRNISYQYDIAVRVNDESGSIKHRRGYVTLR